MRPKKRGDEHENLERWLITYADLITLLLAFFIMMYTFSKQDAQKYQEVAGYLKMIFSGGRGIAQGGHLEGTKAFDTGSLPRADIQKEVREEIEEYVKKDSAKEMTPAQFSDAAIKSELERELTEVISQQNSATAIRVISDDGNVVVRGGEKAFFDPGSASLKDSAKKTLDRIAPILKKTNAAVRVEGHTDNVPITTAEFRSNWELSSRRATEVIQYLIEQHGFLPEKLSAAGYAQYRPIVKNDTVENRALNRRTEIILIRPKGK